MQERAKVVGIDKNVISVVPIDIEACIGCSNSECKDNGHIFTALNRHNLDLNVGSVVRIDAPMRNQLVQALFAVIIPVGLAVLAFIYLPQFIEGAGEGARVGAAFVALLAGGALMFKLRRITNSDLPDVVEVI